jgi:CDP-glucose 4,6-dehydratase
MINLDFFKNKCVLVTGHTGFKGAWLTQWLVSLGANVVGYSLKGTPNTQLFESLNLRSEIIHYDGDINEYDSLHKIVVEHKPEIVFHLAAQAIVKTSYENPIDTFKTNVIGTINLLDSIRKVDSVQVAVIVTSDKCYKNEEKQFGFKETDPMGGDDPYSASKACAELAIHSYRKSFFQNSNTKIVSVRAGNILGGGDWSKDRIVVDAVTSIRNNEEILLRDPSAVRPWQHVLDATYAYLAVAIYTDKNKEDFVPAWNFGPSESEVLNVESLVQMIIKYYGKGSYSNIGEKKYHEANYLKLNVSLSKEKLNWKLKLNNDEIISKTIEWYKEFEKNKDAKHITLKQISEYYALF